MRFAARRADYSEPLVHDVQADPAVTAVVEGFRDGGEDLEAERLPEVYRRGVGLDHGVELHPVVALAARPVEDVRAEGAAGAVAVVGRVDHEARGGDVRAAAGTVGPHLCRAQEPSVVLGDEGPAGGWLHPDGAGLVAGEALGVGVGLAGGDDGVEDGPDPGPVLVRGHPNDHGTTLLPRGQADRSWWAAETTTVRSASTCGYVRVFRPQSGFTQTRSAGSTESAGPSSSTTSATVGTRGEWMS